MSITKNQTVKKRISYDRLFEILYSAGAVPVLLGALFKLTHKAFIFPANTWLTIGLLTEVFVFALSAIRYWLIEEDVATDDSFSTIEQGKFMGIEKLNLSENNILLLNDSIEKLHSNVNQINKINTSSIDTTEFMNSIEKANNTVKTIDEYYTHISGAAAELSKASENSKRINNEMESLLSNINEANKGYEEIAKVFKK